MRIIVLGLLLATSFANAAITFVNDTTHPWALDEDHQYYGNAVLRTPALLDGESAQVELTFTECESTELYVSTSTESFFDVLEVWTDGCLNTTLYGEDESCWNYLYLDFQWYGDHSVVLKYTKNESNSVGSDCCWVWFPGLSDIEITGVDSDDGSPFAMDPAHPWYANQWMYNENSSGVLVPFMQSQEYLADGESSWFSYAVEGRSSFSFEYVISSEESSDYLIVYVDGKEVASYSGECWYEMEEIELPDEGRHVIKWVYRKDNNGLYSGGDSAYVWFDGIDAVETFGYDMSLVYPWQKDQENEYSLRSCSIPDNASSYFSITAKREGWYCFYWKVSSEQNHDKVMFLLNDETYSELSGETDWQSDSVYAFAGDKLSCVYEKDGNGQSVGEDCAWVDLDAPEFAEFKAISHLFPDDELAETTASRTISLNMNTGRVAEKKVLDASEGIGFDSGKEQLCWRTVDDTFCTGGQSLCSGDVNVGEESWVVASVVGSGTVTFYWKVSCADDAAALMYYVDGELRGKIAGEVEWTEVVVSLPDDKRHDIKWCYEKTTSDRAGNDCGWLDAITWVAPDGWDDPDEPIVPDVVSRFITLDLRSSPRIASDVEKIVYDSKWADATEAIVSLNDTEIARGSSGVYEWSTENIEPGTNEFVYSAGDLTCRAKFIIISNQLVEIGREIDFAVTCSDEGNANVLKIPTDWLLAKGIVSVGEDVRNVSQKISEAGKNGAKVWESLVLGLDPSMEESKPTVLPVQTAKADCLTLAVGNIAINPAAADCDIKYRVVYDDAPIVSSSQEVMRTEYTGISNQIEVPLPSRGVRYYRIEIDIR